MSIALVTKDRSFSSNGFLNLFRRSQELIAVFYQKFVVKSLFVSVRMFHTVRKRVGDIPLLFIQSIPATSTRYFLPFLPEVKVYKKHSLAKKLSSQGSTSTTSIADRSSSGGKSFRQHKNCNHGVFKSFRRSQELVVG